MEKMVSYYKSGKNLDIVFTLENNQYSGKIYPRINIIDIDYSD